MKIFKLVTLLFVFTLSANTVAQTEKNFEIIPNLPIPGEQVTISYNPSGTNLKDATNITGIMYIYDNFKWVIKDILLTKTKIGKWETRVQLTEHAALITCVFNSGNEYDRGGKLTYSWIIEKSLGGYVGWGLLRSPVFQNEIPVKLDSISHIKDSVAMMWVKSEMQHHPESRSFVFYEGLTLSKKIKPEGFADRAKKEIRFQLTTPINNLQQYKVQKALDLLEQPANKAFTDSVQKVMLAKYPKGVWARDIEIKKIFTEVDFNRKVALYNAFEKNFPQSNFQDVVTDTEGLYYDKMFKSIAYGYIVNQKDYDYAINSVKKVSYTSLIDYAWHLVGIPFDRDQDGSEKADLATLKKYADAIITEMESREAYLPKDKITELTLSQWQELALQYGAREYFTYAKLLEIFKNYDLERKYLDKIKPLMAYKNASYNEVYVRMLLREGKTAEAKAFMELSAKQNQITPSTIASLKEIYLKEGKKEADFDTYLHSLKADSNEEHKKKLISELINLPIAGFEMESSKGGRVKLADQKGKIVVLDFWAMWCGPCKNAMPGMNMAVNKYKADDNVKFYFIDTQEYIKDFKAQTQAFIKEKGYDFTILYDGKNPKTGKYDDTYEKYAKAFHFSGIPQKMIIDQNGKLRWQSTGYFGSPSELADEISIIIEYLKAEKK